MAEPRQMTKKVLRLGRSLTQLHTHRRLVTISADGATGWSTPRFDMALVEPICMGIAAPPRISCARRRSVRSYSVPRIVVMLGLK